MFSNAVKIFTLRGFDIKLDPSWILIAALITWSLSQQYFPAVMPGETVLVYLVTAIVAMLGFFASLVLHEFAHSIVARQLGLPIREITLFLFGGVAALESEPQSARVEFLVAVAGPIMSICLGFGFWVMAQVVDFTFSSIPLTKVLAYLGTINLILAVFNMIPAFPLDGGRVLRAYLWHRSGDVLNATRIAARSGTIFAYVLMALGVLSLFQGNLIAGLWQIMIGGFVLGAARSSYQDQLARSVFGEKNVDALVKKHPVTISPDMNLEEFANRIMLQDGISFAPVVDGTELLGHIDQSLLVGIDRENWAGTRVGDVFAKLDPSIVVSKDFPVQKLMNQISRTGQRKFLVMDGPDLVGVITLADLTHYLQMYEMLQSS